MTRMIAASLFPVRAMKRGFTTARILTVAYCVDELNLPRWPMVRMARDLEQSSGITRTAILLEPFYAEYRIGEVNLIHPRFYPRLLIYYQFALFPKDDEIFTSLYVIESHTFADRSRQPRAIFDSGPYPERLFERRHGSAVPEIRSGLS
jgi:hypothetical protein